ncbi:DNA polymerase I [Sphingomonas phage Birtae]|nr:DNA polymerase I [Sphingomonas phage Birtae]
MFFEDCDIAPKKRATLRMPPPIPHTGWTPPEFPNLSAATVIAVDTETKDLDLTEKGPGWARKRGHIVGVSLAAKDRQGNTGKWYFPVRHEVQPEYNMNPEAVFGFLKPILENRATPKVGANLIYDIGWLTEENIFVDGPLFDVQFAEALLCEDQVALDTLARKYLGVGKTTNLLYEWMKEAYPDTTDSKRRADIFRAPPSLVGPYAEDDALLPIEIMERQLRELKAQELEEVFRLENDLIPLLVRMRMAGVAVDVPYTEALYHELGTDTQQLLAKINHEFGPLEKSSSGHVGRLLDQLGISYPRTSQGAPSIEKEWLAGLEHPIGEVLLDLREHEKMRSTFCRSYILEKNVGGFIYPQFHPLKGDTNGTLVGRFASSDPNLQNIPSRTKLGKRVRKAFVHDAGHYQWRKHDYSQIHYRILAHFAVGPGADELRAAYCNDIDMDYHDAVYNNVCPLLGWDATDEEQRKFRRRPVKNVNFGLLYGQSEKSLKYKTAMYFGEGFGDAEAKAFFEAYFGAAPYVKPTMQAIGREVQAFGFVRTLLGRKVRFDLWEPAEWGERGMPLPYRAALAEYGINIRRAYEYRGVNYKFQGSEPDIMKSGMRDCLNSGVFDFTGVPRLTVHDELDFSVRDDTPATREAFTFIQHTMQDAIKLRVPVKVDVSTGPNWGEAD